MNNEWEQVLNNSKPPIKGVAKIIQDYKKEVLKLHTLPETADVLTSRYEAEKSFRLSLTRDLFSFIESSCNSCPMGFTREHCKAKQCPLKTLDNILKDKLNQLDQILPGGLK